MKKVLLLGDSIRMGYCKYVKMAFDGSAEIVYPEDCCRFSAYTLRYLGTWKAETHWMQFTGTQDFGMYCGCLTVKRKQHRKNTGEISTVSVRF